jgi:hypothetical protein
MTAVTLGCAEQREAFTVCSSTRPPLLGLLASEPADSAGPQQS